MEENEQPIDWKTQYLIVYITQSPALNPEEVRWCVSYDIETDEVPWEERGNE